MSHTHMSGGLKTLPKNVIEEKRVTDRTFFQRRYEKERIRKTERRKNNEKWREKINETSSRLVKASQFSLFVTSIINRDSTH